MLDSLCVQSVLDVVVQPFPDATASDQGSGIRFSKTIMIPPPLLLYHDISPSHSRLANTRDDSSHFLIIGGGVIGLTTAWALLDAGHHVTIVAKEWASWTKAQRLTSQIAGALWEYPPAVCGQHIDKISLHHSKRWAMTSYHIWRQLADPIEGERKSGVVMKPSGFFFPRTLDENPTELKKMNELSISGVAGFRRKPSLAEEHRINPRHGIVDAYEISAPAIDTDVAMEWLMQLVASKGARFVTEEIREDLLLIEDSLCARFCADAIVNCTGLGSAKVANDASCYPLRGAMIRVINDGKDFPKVKSALAVSADAALDREMVFIVPRNDNILYLGGMSLPVSYP